MKAQRPVFVLNWLHFIAGQSPVNRPEWNDAVMTQVDPIGLETDRQRVTPTVFASWNLPNPGGTESIETDALWTGNSETAELVERVVATLEYEKSPNEECSE